MSDQSSDPDRPQYPKLSGRAAEMLGPERVAAHQRGRLQGAMVEAVDRKGYAAVSVSELVALAGVSKTVFYRHFADKEDCFLETYTEIVRLGTEQIEAAYHEVEGVEGRLRAAFGAFIALATAYGPAGRLVFLASLELGGAAVPAREEAGGRFEAVLAQALAEPDGASVSPLTIRALIGGTREVVYRRMEAEEPERLQEEVEALVDWGLRYRRAAGKGSPAARLLAEVADGSGRPDRHIDWDGPPGSKHARRTLSQRDRIIRATAQLAAEDGYGSLTVNSISARAGTSNQTFYANFESKTDAFLAAFDALGRCAFEQTLAAVDSEDGRVEGGAAGIVVLLEYLAANPMHRRLVFFELPAAGRAARSRAEAMFDVFIRLLEPPELPAPASVRPSRLILEALAGGISAVCEHEEVAGRGDSLPRLAEELINFVLVAFGITE